MAVQHIHRTEGDNGYEAFEPHSLSTVTRRRSPARGGTAQEPPTSPNSEGALKEEQVRFVGAIAQHIRQTLNLQDLVELAAQALGELLQAERVEIVQYFPQLQMWRHIAEYRRNLNAISLIHHDVPEQDNPLSERLKRFEIIQTESPGSTQTTINPHFTRLFPAFWLFIPLNIQGVWGYVSLMQYRAHAWNTAEIGLIQAAVEQIRIAIEHAQLYQQVQNLNQQLEQTVQQRTHELSQALANESMLKRVTDKVRDSLDEAQILETIVEELAALLQLEYCDTGLYDVNLQTCVIVYDYVNHFPSAQGKIIDMTVHCADVYSQLLRCQPVQFCLQSQEAASNLYGQTILACPIFDNQGVLGDLWLFRSAQQAFNELEVRLVQQITNQCAIAIRQARLYQAAQNQVESLEHINHLKDSFLSTVSHELRTPISTIKMAIQMLTLTLGREGLLPDPSKPSLSSNKIAHYLKILNDECNREIGLITDLLDLQQLEAGTHTLTMQSIELSSYLQRISRPFQEQATKQGQTLVIDIESKLPSVWSDPQSLERILVELLTNACKYTPAGESIHLSAQVMDGNGAKPMPSNTLQSHPSTSPTKPTTIRITVMNSGVEIPPNHLGQVFDKFYRIPSSDPHRHSGTGLGLALVKKLAPQIGGQVSAASEQGQTCFTIELPVVALES